jgi:hypothetical protein
MAVHLYLWKVVGQAADPVLDARGSIRGRRDDGLILFDLQLQGLLR